MSSKKVFKNILLIILISLNFFNLEYSFGFSTDYMKAQEAARQQAEADRLAKEKQAEADKQAEQEKKARADQEAANKAAADKVKADAPANEQLDTQIGIVDSEIKALREKHPEIWQLETQKQQLEEKLKTTTREWSGKEVIKSQIEEVNNKINKVPRLWQLEERKKTLETTKQELADWKKTPTEAQITAKKVQNEVVKEQKAVSDINTAIVNAQNAQNKLVAWGNVTVNADWTINDPTGQYAASQELIQNLQAKADWFSDGTVTWESVITEATSWTAKAENIAKTESKPLISPKNASEAQAWNSEGVSKWMAEVQGVVDAAEAAVKNLKTSKENNEKTLSELQDTVTETERQYQENLEAYWAGDPRTVQSKSAAEDAKANLKNLGKPLQDSIRKTDTELKQAEQLLEVAKDRKQKTEKKFQEDSPEAYAEHKIKEKYNEQRQAIIDADKNWELEPGQKEDLLGKLENAYDAVDNWEDWAQEKFNNALNELQRQKIENYKAKCKENWDCLTESSFMMNTKSTFWLWSKTAWNKSRTTDAKATINSVIWRIIQNLMIALWSLSLLIMTVWAGYMILYHGQDEYLSKWKWIFMAGITSLVIALSSYILVDLVRYVLYWG